MVESTEQPNRSAGSEIRRLTADENGIDVEFAGRAPLRLSWTWLRDHSRDPESFLDSAQQRLVPASTVARCGPGRARLTANGVEIDWPDGPATTYDTAFLATIGDQRTVMSVGAAPASWDGAGLRARVSPIEFDDLIDSSSRREVVDQLWRTGIVLVASVPTDPSSTRRVLELFGYLRRTIFGELWEFGSDGALDDTASTRLEITPHTDGTYSNDAPGLLGLHCYVSDAMGGENVFVDGLAVAELLSEAARHVLASVDIPARYIGDGTHLVASRPALRYHGDRLVQVSYNHHDRAPFVLSEPAMTELYRALHEFDALASSPDLRFEWAMRPGDMAVFDNWRLLHGRRSFRGERWMAGGYVNREDFESSTRLLARH